MTISEVNKAIEDMRKIVPFKDEETNLLLDSIYTKSESCRVVTINTRIYDVDIEMKKGVPIEF